VLVLSQYVETVYAHELLADARGGVGYLLKDRVTSLDEVTDAVRRVQSGGTVLDPLVVRRLMAGTDGFAPAHTA
jgi:DNA-binding NarL/FixJ family response regulator